MPSYVERLLKNPIEIILNTSILLRFKNYAKRRGILEENTRD